MASVKRLGYDMQSDQSVVKGIKKYREELHEFYFFYLDHIVRKKLKKKI